MRNLYLIACSLIFLSGCFTSEEEKLIEKSKAAIALKLTDPESAQFRRFSVFRSVTDGAAGYDFGNTVVCGEVNSKNRMGGFDGFRFAIAMFVDDANSNSLPIVQIVGESDFLDRDTVYRQEAVCPEYKNPNYKFDG